MFILRCSIGKTPLINKYLTGNVRLMKGLQLLLGIKLLSKCKSLTSEVAKQAGVQMSLTHQREIGAV